MAYALEAPPAPEVEDQEETGEVLTPEARLQRAIGRADTLGEVSKEIEREKQILQYEIDVGIHDVSSDVPQQVRALLQTRQEVIAPLGAEYGNVQVATLDPGVGGMAPVGGAVSEIYVSADQVAHGTATDIKGILIHEVRHTDQVDLQTGTGPVLILGDEAVKVDTVLLEGDTESFVIDTTGVDRDDRPPAVYGEGLKVAREIQEDNAQLWTEVLTNTGKVEDLQNAAWTQYVGVLSTAEIAEQAEATGYDFNEQFIAAQNQEWVEQAEQGTLTGAEVEEQAAELGIEVDSEVEARILSFQDATRDRFQNGPDTTERKAA